MPDRIPKIDEEIWHKHAWHNRVHSILLLCLMFGLATYLGGVVAGKPGIISAIFSVVILVVIHPSISPFWIMRIYRARQVSTDEAPQLAHILAVISERAGLKVVPKLYYLPTEILNAFATGSPSKSAIAISDGLLRNLDWREIAGILGHEVSHIKNNDLWVMGMADLFSRITRMFSLLGIMLVISYFLGMFAAEDELSFNWLAILLLVFAPHITALAQLALSRTREFNADLNAARLTGDPDGLASALAKIERIQGGWFGRMLFPGRQVPDPSILRTHPETKLRILKLKQLKSNELLSKHLLNKHLFPHR